MMRIYVAGAIITVDAKIIPRFYLPTVGDGHISQRFIVGISLHSFDISHDPHPLDHLPEHHVLPVQVRAVHRGDEELGAVGVGAGVGHRQQTSTLVLQMEVFILKLGSINTGSSSSICILKISTLKKQSISILQYQFLESLLEL